MQSYCESFTKIAKKEARLRFLLAEGIFVNGLALGEEADLEALNCQSSTKVDTR
jgi:hypothetical protein